MKKYSILHAILVTLFLTATAFSQDTNQNSEEKKVVIDEIVKVLKAEEQIQTTMRATVEQMNAMYPNIVDSIVDSNDKIPPAEKAKVKAEMIKRHAGFNKRFNDKMFKAINFQEFTAAVFYPLYDKFFTLEELKDLLTFYKSPTGQKLNSISPQFTAETVKLTQTYLLPKIDGVVKELLDEDLKNAGGK